MRVMPAVATGPMIRREIGDDHVCLLVFDRPESGANIFDAATLDELNEHLDSVENDNSLRGLDHRVGKKINFRRRRRFKDSVTASAKRRHAGVHCSRPTGSESAGGTENSDCRRNSRRIRWWRL